MVAAQWPGPRCCAASAGKNGQIQANTGRQIQADTGNYELADPGMYVHVSDIQIQDIQAHMSY